MSPLPAPLQSSPRAPPPWMSAIWRTYLSAGLIAAMGLGALGVALEVSTEAKAGDGPPDGSGTVISTETIRRRRSHHGQITFSYAGETHRCAIPDESVGLFSAGSDLPVWVLKGYINDDVLVEPCARYVRDSAGVRATMFALMGILALGIGAFFFLKERRRYLVVTTGKGAVGHVDGVTVGRGKGGPRYTVFASVDGPESFTVKATHLSGPWMRMTQGVEPTPGEIAYVVYDPARPSRNEIWGFDR